jgi:hypothetical protein
MITPLEIATKARQQYPRLLRAWLADTLPAQFPLPIRSNKGSLHTDPVQRLRQLAQLRAGSREALGQGYTVHWHTVRSPQHGEQGVPAHIEVEDLDNYLALCSLRADFKLFAEQATFIRQQQPALTQWLATQPERVVPLAGHWPALLRVCTYFLQHPLPEVYARQVPSVPSKFVEQHEGILGSLLGHLLPPASQRPGTSFASRFGLRTDPPVVRFRLLDAALATHVGGLTDLTIPQPDFEKLTLASLPDLKVVVVENKLTFLTLPPLPATLAVWGSGSGLAFLRHCHWLHTIQLYYWGDIDLHGFHILAQLRAYFPGTTSVLMDATTYNHHCVAAHAGPVPTQGIPALLTPSEARTYQLLLANPTQNRLEQEHIDYEHSTYILQSTLA